ncbi:MAG: DUF480 domain-containing protein [Candidatus Thiodiazotropha sp.]
MRIELDPLEARVIGAMLEKEVTTPEQYPLSLNALISACNQKSSRDPVMELSEAEVQSVVDGLVKKHLVSERSGFGSRVAKYQHRFCNTGFGGFEFSAQEAGILCVLLLRGPQTPGELRTRTQRLCRFDDVQETETVLQGLMERTDGPFVARLTREPGKREARYCHLFGGEPPAATHEETPEQPPQTSQLEALASTVMALQAEVDALKQRVAQLEGQ